MARLTLAGLPVVVQWEAWVRGDQRLLLWPF